ncbi:hypothetical protein [Corynebacterium meridianum]|uniref:Nucleotide exchange factor GrpE n=1 Tax=Corynebacterium meridianum TaxID=2765363 RepID=A0A934I433_9CORY|nr:hypothetical protein [Corynebacterium meridianum]MBI8988829.1 hypothetical protein [Corynebacterium meridianum]MCK7676479.1 hypothetical protein [Corynebacterium meridianum]
MDGPGRGFGDYHEELNLKLDQLADLFRRRLIEDRNLRAAFEAQQRKIQELESEVLGERMLPIMKQICLIADRCLTQGDDPFAASVVDELKEVVEASGYSVIDGSEEFDPLAHEVVGRSEHIGDFEVVGIGLRYHGRILLPARVVLPASCEL